SQVSSKQPKARFGLVECRDVSLAVGLSSQLTYFPNGILKNADFGAHVWRVAKARLYARLSADRSAIEAPPNTLRELKPAMALPNQTWKFTSYWQYHRCMSSPRAPGPIKPPKPKDFTQDNVGVMLDRPHTSTVIGIDFFRELGLELEGRATIEGEWA